MIRTWVRSPTKEVLERIQKAHSSSFYILQGLGPTGFLIKAGNKKWKVLIGSHHTCNCPHFLSKKGVCVHILWVLLKVFQVSLDSELIFQSGLIEREITDILQEREKNVVINSEPKIEENTLDESEKGIVARPVSASDICPICQESLQSSNLKLTHCRLGCGNHIHLKCIKVLMDHQIGSMGLSMVKCPLCRCDFNTVECLKKEIEHSLISQKKNYRQPVQYGVSCSECKKDPIIGKYHKCNVCRSLHLCDECFIRGLHDQHTFQNRLFRNGKWISSSRNVAPVLPQGFINDLQNRDITDEDYQTLLLLDSGPSKQASIPLHIINSFTLYKYSVNKPETENKCKICGELFYLGAMIRKIPCSHSFHQSCIDRWLLNQRTSCPVCGLAAYSAIDDECNDDADARYIAKTYEKKVPVKKSLKISRPNRQSQNFIEVIGVGAPKLDQILSDSIVESSPIMLSSSFRSNKNKSSKYPKNRSKKEKEEREPLESFIFVQSISTIQNFSSSNSERRMNLK